MSNETKIAVIEGKWFKNQNISVRGLFDLVSDINFDSPHEYHYEMFNNDDAFQEIIERLAVTDSVHNLYIAAHGNKGALVGSNHEEISLAKVRNSVKKISQSDGKMHSIYFGSCSFGNQSNLKSLLLSAENNQIRWVAGYTTDVDFIKSSFLDALFWNLYIRDTSEAPLQKVKNVCKTLLHDAGGLVEELGFTVLAYDGRSSNPIMELT